VPTANEPNTIYEHGWIVRIQPPKVDEQPPKTDALARSVLLLHGWTGDEKVMWIFARSLPPNTWIFAPRGPVPTVEGGYGWLPREDDGKWPALQDFVGIAEALRDAFRHWATSHHAPREGFDVMGFSQGAAMAYALAAFYPKQVGRVAALAGFLPPDETFPGRYSALKGKKIYVAHGTKDETVPVSYAKEAVSVLEGVEARVTYCESAVGHKLSAGCLKGLDSFWTEE
jgi:phospholipase/carboxylesterase